MNYTSIPPPSTETSSPSRSPSISDASNIHSQSFSWWQQDEDLAETDCCTCDWIETMGDFLLQGYDRPSENLSNTEECSYCKGTGRVLRG
eukprot:Ihof_evm3s692 gene=Ihof_evmTU3s692